MIPKPTYAKFKSLIALLIAFSLFSSSVFAASIPFLGNIYHAEEKDVSAGLSISQVYGEDEKSGYQKAFIFDYIPGNGTYPISPMSDGVYGKSTLSSIIEYASGEGDNIVAGMNGDFFSFLTGVPMGVMISGGRLLSSSDQRSAIGFLPDGSAVIGYPDVVITVDDFSGTSYPVTYFNKYPSQWGAYLVNRDFSTTTQSTEKSTEIVIEISRGDFLVSASIVGVVKEIRENSVNSEIPENCAVLCISNNFKDFADYQSLTPGTFVKINISIDDEWLNVIEAVGGEDIIVSEGEIVPGIVNEPHESAANPRISAGIRADGSVVFFAIDGRQTGHSRGVTLLEIAGIMKDMGCISAINLDGGGSLTVAAKYHGDDTAHIINSPSDGYQRKVANAILFVNRTEKDYVPAHLYVSSNSSVVLAGSTIDLNISVLDSGFYEIYDNYDTTYSYSCSNGIGYAFAKNFTASRTPSQGKITASATIDGTSVSGSRSITVTDRLDSISVIPVELALTSNSEMGIGVQAIYYGLPVAFSYDALKYSFQNGNTKNTSPVAVASGSLGYLTHDGIFHSYAGASGTDVLTISYGSVSCEVKITVADFTGMILHDFDEGESSFAAIDIFVSGNTYLNMASTVHGKNNSKGLAFNYYFNDLTAENSEYDIGSGRAAALKYSSPVIIPEGALYIDVWAKDLSFGKPYITVVNSDGIEYDIPYDTAKDYSAFNGWRLLRAYLGEASGLSLVSPFKLVYTGKALAYGTVILDNMYMATDQASYVFEDSQNSWATNFIEEMYYMEIAEGSIESGLRYYNPEKDLTRQEFAKMLASFMCIDTSLFSGFELHFTDASSIASWADAYVRAVVGSGYMNGIANGDGTVSFNPNGIITRQEVMQVFGNLLKSLGISSPQNTALPFSDSYKIAKWAYDNVLLTVNSSIINGFDDNTLRPENQITRAEISAVFIRSTAEIRR